MYNATKSGMSNGASKYQLNVELSYIVLGFRIAKYTRIGIMAIVGALLKLQMSINMLSSVHARHWISLTHIGFGDCNMVLGIEQKEIIVSNT